MGMITSTDLTIYTPFVNDDGDIEYTKNFLLGYVSSKKVSKQTNGNAYFTTYNGTLFLSYVLYKDRFLSQPQFEALEDKDGYISLCKETIVVVGRIEKDLTIKEIKALSHIYTIAETEVLNVGNLQHFESLLM